MRTIVARTVLMVASVASLFVSVARAQTTATWLNAASGDWYDPLNWSSNPNVPNNGQPNLTDTYNVVISPIGGNYSVSLLVFNGTTTIDSLTLNSPNATLLQQNHTLNVLNGATISSGIYSLDVATFSGGALRVNSAMEWATGGMLAGGTTTIASGAQLNCGTGLVSGSTPFRNLARTLDNFGTVNLRAGNLSLNGGTILNEASGVINLDLNSPPSGFGLTGTGIVSNLGRININGGTFTPTLVNSGTVIINALASAQFFNAIHNANSFIGGAGSIGLTGIQTFTSGVTTLAGGNINLSQGNQIVGAGDLVLTGAMNFNSGTIGGTGVMTVAPGATLAVGTDGTILSRLLTRRLNNSGVINIGVGTFSIPAPGGSINNMPGGIINIAPGGSLSAIGSGTPLLSNQGTINFNIGAGTNTLVPLMNSGTIAVNSGFLFFNTGTHLTGSTITGAGNLYFANSVTGFGSHTFLGTSTLAGGNMNLPNGSFSGTGDIILTGTLNWGSGSITTSLGGGSSSAQLNIRPGGMLNVGTTTFSSSFLTRQTFNSGVVNLNGGSLILGFNSTFTNQTGGVINVNPRTSIFGQSGSLLLTNLGQINIMAGNEPQAGGGSFVFNTGLVNAGTISADSGSTVFVNFGTTTHLAGSTVKGVASIDFGSGSQIILGTTTLAGKNMFMGSALFPSGAQFVGPGSVNLTGTLSWTAGSFGATTSSVPGVGSLNIGTTGVLNLDVMRNFRTLFRQADNFGVVNFNSGTVLLQNVTFNNRTGGVLNISSTLNFAGSGSGNLFNGGTVNLLNPSITISVPFVNLGVVNVLGPGPVPFLQNSFTNGGQINGALTTDSLPVTLLDGASGGAIDGNSAVNVVSSATASVGRLRQDSLTIQPDAVLTLESNGTAEGTSVVHSLQLQPVTAKQLNLTDNHFIVDYDPMGTNPYTTIRSAVTSGAIFSSIADATHKVGYADNTALHRTTFGGLSVDESSVLMSLTFTGDTNLDGQVDVTDLGALATHWQTPGDWTDGDFNYDGFIDVTDLGALATNWQAGVGAGSPLRAATFTEALASVGLGGVTVPEPTTALSVACLTLTGLLRRRR